jgi:selenocysteine-specific elongation factor
MFHIIGTAGHVDHGKTTLIKALTGCDTDRLKEEKERGISIELGFAYLDLPDGTRAGVVDVPGHERFIRHMLAGAHGIDLVLFTVAADDGVMPQTEEHLDIVHLLGIESAIFIVTKTDLASDARIAEVEEEIEILTAGTSLENSPTAHFSSVTGQGLDEIRALITAKLNGGMKPRASGYFRLPVDRVFTLAGHGLVVTGTAQTGEVHLGERVRCLPGDQTFRVRSIQVHNEGVETATRGQRVALNLSGAEKAAIQRGDVICHERLTMSTARFDASLDVRPSAAKGIKNHQRVRVHLGTAERLAKVIVLGSAEVARPKATAYCQVVLTEPLVALRGDRFVVRDETGRRTLAGGIVLHPWPGAHRRHEPCVEVKLQTLQLTHGAAAVEWFVTNSEEFAVEIAPLYHFLNVRVEEAATLVNAASGLTAVMLDGEAVYTTVPKWRALQERVLCALHEFHAAHPLEAGRDMEELRARIAPAIAAKLFRAFIERLEDEKIVTRHGSHLSVPGHTVSLDDHAQAVARQIRNLIAAAPLAPPDVKQLEDAVLVDRAKLTEVLRVLEREQSIVRVGADMYFLKETLDELKRLLIEAFIDRGEVTPAMFRDRFGTSRKYAIPLLEYFDRAGVTVRVGDIRRLRKERVQSETYRPEEA